MERRRMTFPKWGLGGIIVEDPSKPWVNSKDFFCLLDICTDELGIHYIDSAERYGECEKTLGQWFHLVGSEKYELLKIGSKVGPVADDSGLKNQFSCDYIFETAKKSLSLMGLKRLNIYWMHNPDPNTPWKETFSGFHKIVQEGLADHIGISNVSVTEIKEILDVCVIYKLTTPKFVQNEFNLLNHELEEDVIKFCEANGLHYMAFSPMAGGILTGKYNLNEFPTNTRWSYWKHTRGLPNYWKKSTFDGIEKLKNIAQEKKISVGGLCIAWVHFQPGIKTTLLGPRRLDQLNVIRDAQNISLDRYDLDRIKSCFSVS
jgi:aryl-alcohol dehydrogenase-like predicted oxidoreductase